MKNKLRIAVALSMCYLLMFSFLTCEAWFFGGHSSSSGAVDSFNFFLFFFFWCSILILVPIILLLTFLGKAKKKNLKQKAIPFSSKNKKLFSKIVFLAGLFWLVAGWYLETTIGVLIGLVCMIPQIATFLKANKVKNKR